MPGGPFCSVWLAPAQGGEQTDNEKKGPIAGRTKCQTKDLGHKCAGCSDQPPLRNCLLKDLGASVPYSSHIIIYVRCPAFFIVIIV